MATDWELADKDGYQQTTKSEAFPNGYSWHLVEIDNVPHLDAALPGRA